MKKITLLLLSLVLFFKLDIVEAQSIEVRNKIMENYGEHSRQLNLAIQSTLNETNQAWRIAEEKSIPITGVDMKGNVYSLVKFNEEGVPIYKATLNKGSRITARVDGIKNTAYRRELRGHGIFVGVFDGEVALDQHREFVDRVTNKSVVILGESLPDFNSPGFSKTGFERGRAHATHVTGTIVAQGLNERALGIAPHATVLSYSWNNDIFNMLDLANDGLLVSNHSYGFQFFDEYGFLYDQSLRHELGAYVNESRMVDIVAYERKFYQPVFAAGNDGEYTKQTYRNFPEKKNVDMLNGYSLSKNAVVVAAVKEVKNYVGAESVVLASFSSQGPSNDFRIKPDISAKGDMVFSTTYKNPANMNNDPNTGLYVSYSGTSMAAPAVTGVFALWQEWASKRNKDKNPLKSASIRAIMAHTADQTGERKGPNHLFGWGLINAAKGVQFLEASRKGEYALLLEHELKNKEVYSKEIVVKKATDKLVVTLAWTDIAGGVDFHLYRDEDYTKKNPILVNDLDIVVKKDGIEYLPWKLNKDWSNPIALKGNNDVDNIEQIEIEDVEPGTYTIYISHKGDLSYWEREKELKQEFSLAMSLSDAYTVEKIPGEDKKDELVKLIQSLWPNPIIDFVNIQIMEEFAKEAIYIRVYDTTGRLVHTYEKKNDEGLYSFSMEKLPKGMYFIDLQVGEYNIVEKVVKK
ncbi:S8 family peptidase [Myroides albus]|uniref:S8/S53 family peptidase n=1 Tax=Myroides albus TaxID=2562892 RepID=UPI0021596874|nr:S8/S53 family peptidase [Myroides albus]UVD80321.1 S8 family peptidase [Myroides albus]